MDVVARRAAERDRVVRYTVFERVVHWTVAGTFVYTILTGLALFSPSFYWLAGVFGGGPVIRAWHPIIGVVFTIMLVVMWLRWAADLRLERHDREWLKHVKEYARGEEESVPEAGRFNAGQKLSLYLVAGATILLLLTGIVIWFPAYFGAGLRRVSFIVHDLAALAGIGYLILHIYMGVFVIRGSLEGMTEGTVSRRWAEVHHGRWYRQQRSGSPRPHDWRGS